MTEEGSLTFSCTKVECVLTQPGMYEGAFRIMSSEGYPTTGKIYSSDIRMECMQEDFTGSDEEIHFCFHGENLAEGEVARGSFQIISNKGEYLLPFTVEVRPLLLESSIGTIKNMFHFADLAKSHWQEAVKLFYSPGFARAVNGADSRHRAAYSHLSCMPGNEQNVEEFLIHINKKQKMEYVTEEREIQLEAKGNFLEVLEKELHILRGGWGYTRLQIASEGGFVFAEKEVLTDDDFLGNRCRLPVYVDCSRCRQGKNFGKIILYNAFVRLEVPVIVSLGDGGERMRVVRFRKQMFMRMMQLYISFRLKKISVGNWIKETGKLLERLSAMDESDIAVQLFRMHLLITDERYNEAEWLVKHVEELLEQYEWDEMYHAYYWYLTSLLRKEDSYVQMATEQVEGLYKRKKCWQIAWLLLYMNREYNRSAVIRLEFIEEQFERGCRSPLMYLEAMQLINNNPGLLRKLDRFELQVLYFAARYQNINADVIEQLLYLSGRKREYDPVLLRILMRLCKKKNDAGLIQEICALLIRGGLRGHRYQEWYRKGVDQQLRIVNLYEYFMMSLDLSKENAIPKTALIYFNYQNNLPYEYTAYLYDYILQHRERMQDMAENYRVKMEQFALQQIYKDHINVHLANIYKHVLTPELIDARSAVPLSSMVFACEIKVNHPDIRKVMVYENGREYPLEAPLVNGKAWLPIYGDEYTIGFTDAKGNCYTASVEYSVNRLMQPRLYLDMIRRYDTDNRELELYLCNIEGVEITQAKIRQYVQLLDNKAVDAQIRKDIRTGLWEYYFDKDEHENLLEIILATDMTEVSKRERTQAVRYLVLMGQYEHAYDMVCRFGPDFVDVKMLVRMVSALMEQGRTEGSLPMLYACSCAFSKSKYDANVLQYLVSYYRGPVRVLRDIWIAALSYDIDCRYLARDMMKQMLYSGVYVGEEMDIFRYYLAHEGDRDTLEAFMIKSCFDYFVSDKLVEECIFREVARMYDAGKELPLVCRYAYAKYYAEHRQQLTPDILETAELFLREMLDDNILMNFMRAYKEFEDVQQILEDRVIIEYQGSMQNPVRISYRVVHENSEYEEESTEYMRDICGGLYVKEFLLFFGESLQYYMTEIRDGEEEVTESATIQRGETTVGSESSKYQLINDIIISRNMGDYTTMDHLLDEYFYKEFLHGKLFRVY